MDKEKYDVSIIALFGGGVNEQFLKSEVKYKAVFPRMIPGNSHIMKIFTPQKLHDYCVREHYDIEVSYLEGVSARIISGCRNERVKLVSWIHVEQHTLKKLAYPFRNKKEARKCYERFDQTVCVSEFVKSDFCKILNYQKPVTVLYNTVESDKIRQAASESVDKLLDKGVIKLIAVGTLKKSKGYIRLLKIIQKLKYKFPIHLYILGIGPMENEIKKYLRENDMEGVVTLLGYKTNPYKYIANCDLFVCASFAEGFSTAVTEALILGVPICTVNVSGMKELLGENNEYGIVTSNDERSLYNGIKQILSNKEQLRYYTQQARKRGEFFDTHKTVEAVERMLEEL